MEIVIPNSDVDVLRVNNQLKILADVVFTEDVIERNFSDGISNKRCLGTLTIQSDDVVSEKVTQDVIYAGGLFTKHETLSSSSYYDSEECELNLNIALSPAHFDELQQKIHDGQSILLTQGHENHQWMVNFCVLGERLSERHDQVRANFFLRYTTLGICLGEKGYLQTFASETYKAQEISSLSLRKLKVVSNQYRELFENLRYFVPNNDYDGLDLTLKADLFQNKIASQSKEESKKARHAYNYFYHSPVIPSLLRAGEQEHETNRQIGKWVISQELHDFLSNCSLLSKIYSPSLGHFLVEMGVASETIEFGRYARSDKSLYGVKLTRELILPIGKSISLRRALGEGLLTLLFRVAYSAGVFFLSYFLITAFTQSNDAVASLISSLVSLYSWHASKPIPQQESTEEQLLRDMAMLSHELKHQILSSSGIRWPVVEHLFNQGLIKGARYQSWVYRVFSPAQPWRN